MPCKTVRCRLEELWDALGNDTFAEAQPRPKGTAQTQRDRSQLQHHDGLVEKSSTTEDSIPRSPGDAICWTLPLSRRGDPARPCLARRLEKSPGRQNFPSSPTAQHSSTEAARVYSVGVVWFLLIGGRRGNSRSGDYRAQAQSHFNHPDENCHTRTQEAPDTFRPGFFSICCTAARRNPYRAVCHCEGHSPGEEFESVGKRALQMRHWSSWWYEQS